MAMKGPATPAALYKMISIPDAQEVVLRETLQTSTETRPLHSAIGTILAEDVLAVDNLPPFPASIKVVSPRDTDGKPVAALAGSPSYRSDQRV